MEGIVDLNITMPTLLSWIPSYLFFLKKIVSTITVCLLPKLNKTVEIKSRYKLLDIDNHLLWFDCSQKLSLTELLTPPPPLGLRRQ